jgi:ABC-type dipeptide/oligopeptide/nickel transport system ATPase component
VTHGVHWLPMVDRVIVMKDGIISEAGSYEELVSHNGPFAQFLKIYFLQKSKEEDIDDPEGNQFSLCVWFTCILYCCSFIF